MSQKFRVLHPFLLLHVYFLLVYYEDVLRGQ